MGTPVKTAVFALACCAIAFAAVTVARGQLTSAAFPASLDAALYRSVAERVPTPLVFSTRDTVFALSLPTDEPAAVYVRLTVGKNGKVKEKQTRAHANHIAGYVAPAFLAATKDLKVDRALLVGINGKDTSLILTFPLEYQCVLDTVNKATPEGDLADRIATPFYYMEHYKRVSLPATVEEREKEVERRVMYYPDAVLSDYLKSSPTRVWYYLAFIKDRSE